MQVKNPLGPCWLCAKALLRVLCVMFPCCCCCKYRSNPTANWAESELRGGSPRFHQQGFGLGAAMQHVGLWGTFWRKELWAGRSRRCPSPAAGGPFSPMGVMWGKQTGLKPPRRAAPALCSAARGSPRDPLVGFARAAPRCDAAGSVQIQKAAENHEAPSRTYPSDIYEGLGA